MKISAAAVLVLFLVPVFFIAPAQAANPTVIQSELTGTWLSIDVGGTVTGPPALKEASGERYLALPIDTTNEDGCYALFLDGPDALSFKKNVRESANDDRCLIDVFDDGNIAILPTYSGGGDTVYQLKTGNQVVSLLGSGMTGGKCTTNGYMREHYAFAVEDQSNWLTVGQYEDIVANPDEYGFCLVGKTDGVAPNVNQPNPIITGSTTHTQPRAQGMIEIGVNETSEPVYAGVAGDRVWLSVGGWESQSNFKPVPNLRYSGAGNLLVPAYKDSTLYVPYTVSSADSLSTGTDLMMVSTTGPLIDQTLQNKSYERIYRAADGETLSNVRAYVGADNLLYVLAESSTNDLLFGQLDAGDWTWKKITTPANLGDYTAVVNNHSNVEIYATIAGELEYFQVGVALQKTSVAVSNLVGFDVDGTGSNLIVRTHGGANVTAYSATSLTPSNTIATPNCARADGVAATSQALSFLDCNSSNEVEAIEVRGPSLAALDLPSNCNGGHCETTIDGEFFFGSITVPTELRQIGPISSTPFDYTRGSTDGSNFATVAFAFSTFDGKVGTWAITFNEGGANWDDLESLNYDTAAGPDVVDLCAWASGASDLDMIAAVSPNAPTKAWSVDVLVQDRGIGGEEEPVVTVNQEFSNNVAFAGAEDIGCSQDRAYVLVDGTLHAVNVTGPERGLVAWTLPGLDAHERAVSASADGEYVTWSDDGQIHVAQTSDGAIQTSVPIPSGEIVRGVEIDQFGQALWIFTDSSITRYEIFSATTGTPVSGGTTDEFGNTITSGGGPGTEGADSGSLIDTTGFAVLFGGSGVAASAFLGMIVVVGMASVTTLGASRFDNTLMGVVVGVPLGIATAWAFGLFSNSVIFVLVVLVIGSLGLWLWGSRR